MGKIDLEKLILFGNVREDAAVCKAVEISGALYSESSSLSASDGPVRMYYDVQRELLSKYENIRGNRGAKRAPTYWKRHILGLIIGDENAFSLSSERGCFDNDLIALAAVEIPTLKALYELDWNRIAAVFGGETSCVANMRPTPAEGESAGAAPDAVLLTPDANDAARALAEYYSREGCGVLADYAAFRWETGLVGVRDRDSVSFDDLIGYERQKEQIIENAEFFVSGKPYSNMLLYGDRGTGKSSSVKALLNMFRPRGLRLVALPKADIDALPVLTDALAPRGCKFIVFIDDLSFEENETGYKSFKSALEGSVRSQPANILVCATSNRRNIIKEVWREREDRDEINLNDALQEKRSLADRFGLTVTFSAPDKSEYLDIVRGLARREGLETDENELTGLALQWELRHSGRSGRAARQFVNYMLSRTAFER
ncbi:MAG: ATP-binding protein [Clostridiales Family XIII bacterium]|jgi:predicted AAA+ superfamily ATPase|nr:ATP-binding protein [Clostridiales Family XIII bacterium]